ncbi:hypothetical protein KR038_004417 [Drosophila bunnanda]|nr:hypothetical protein KR038_004417 [Drosophila bunnanda]
MEAFYDDSLTKQQMEVDEKQKNDVNQINEKQEKDLKQIDEKQEKDLKQIDEKQEKDLKQINEKPEKNVKQLNEEQEKDVKQLFAGIEAEVTGTTKGEPETELKTLECDKTLRVHLGKRVCMRDPTDVEPDLKKKMVEESKPQDVADAAPSKGEGVASKKIPEQEAVNVPKSSPGTPKTAPTTPKGTASQEINPIYIEPDLKKKMVEENKPQDVADAAPSKGEGVASKKIPEQEAVNVPKSSPGIPKTAPSTPKGTASQEKNPIYIEPDLKKKMVEESKPQDVADAAPSKGEEVASKKIPEQEAVNVPKSSPGTPKTAPTTPKGTASQEINPDDTPAGPKLIKDVGSEVAKTIDGEDADKPETEDKTGKDTGKADKADEDPREDGVINERIES